MNQEKVGMTTGAGDLPGDPLSGDMDYVLRCTDGLWEDLRGKRLFMTGGTGFFGSWLLESFVRANAAHGLQASVVVLTRDRAGFARKFPRLAKDPSIGFHGGDVRDFAFPEGEFSHVIHAAATSASATFEGVDPQQTFDIIVEGTRRTLEFAARCRAKKFLFTSSGTVYGKQPPGIALLTEEHEGAPDPTDAGAFLGEAKRAAELLCALAARKHGIEVKIARCFSFVGPQLPLDVHYAAGNFIRDGLNGGPIKVRGDGMPYRSYLYAADLAVWLWTLFVRGRSCRAYNVGSDEPVSIAELASLVARCFPQPVEVNIAATPQPDRQAERYVPSTERAARELGLRKGFDLRQAIERTIAYHRVRS